MSAVPPAHTIPAFLVVVFTVGLASAPVSGQDPPREHDDWLWSVYLATEFPLSLTLGAQLELPSRWRFRLGFGSVPEPYAETANNAAAGLGAYDDVTAEVIAAALQSSGVFDLDVGWRPNAGSGWTISAGLTTIALGGSTSTEDVLAAVTGEPPPHGAGEGARLYNINSTLTLLTLDTGYEWRLHEDWSLRVWAGWAFTIAAQSSITFNFNAGLLQPLFDLFAQSAAVELDEIYRSYVHPPIVGTSLHYNF